MRSQKDIPTGKIKRGSLVGITTARAGIKKMQFLSKKPFMSEKEKDRFGRLNDEEIAKIIFKALGSLRGTALKAAQMLSMEMELLPEEYRNELAKAASSVPPINRALIRKIITTQLGDPPEKVFSSFESTPFAAASLGQVHRAVSHKGEDLAVKVQYPGIAASVTSDIDMLKALLKPSRYARIFSKCFDEVQERIAEELDYLKEAENTTWFRDNIDMDNIIIPKVFPELTTSKVLTTSMVHGLHLNEWLNTNPTKEKKDYYGQLFVDLFNHTTLNKMKIHADPNTGNYLFRDDDKLGVIDFGCVKKLSKDFVKSIKLSPELYENFNMAKLKKFYDNFGINFNHDFVDNEFQDFLLQWVEWITRPQREAYFDFSENCEYFDEGMEHLKQFYSFIDYFEGDFTFYGRSFYGLERILQTLGARVDMRF